MQNTAISSSKQNPPGLEASIHQPSKHRTAFSEAAEAYWAGDYSTARNILNPILRDNPDNDSALRLLAKSCEDNNPAPSLRSSAGRLVKAFHNSGKQDRNLLRRAFKLVHIAQAYDPRQQDDALYYHLALIAHAEEDTEKTKEYLNRVFDIDPDHKKSQKLMRSLQATDLVSQPPATTVQAPALTIQANDRRATEPYRPSPEGSPIALFMREFHEVHNSTDIGLYAPRLG